MNRIVRMVIVSHLLVQGTVSVAARGAEFGGDRVGVSVRGDGGWKTDGKAQRAAQRWNIDLKRLEDDTLTGLVTIEDSPLMHDGTLAGKIEGGRVSGTIQDDKGLHVATFVGTANGSGGFRGSYEDRTGEVGDWEWAGPLP